MVITESKNRLTALREILEYKNKIHETRNLNLKREEQVENESDKLETEGDKELKLLKKDLNFLALRNRHLVRPNSLEEEREYTKTKTIYFNRY